MEEMRNLIGRRQGEYTPRSRPRSLAADLSVSYSPDTAQLENFASSVEELVSEADSNLARVADYHEVVQDDFKQLASDFKEVCSSQDDYYR